MLSVIILCYEAPIEMQKVFNNIFIQLGFPVRNWQKVQLNTDLFSDMKKYLYTREMALFKAW